MYFCRTWKTNNQWITTYLYIMKAKIETKKLTRVLTLCGLAI